MLGSLWKRIRSWLPPPHDERELLRLCRGDVEQMRRLIAYETSRRPGLSHRAACRAAIDRLRHDRS